MNDEQTPGNEAEPVTGGDGQPPRKPYSPPRIVSIEPLEATAATCDPPVGGFGKTLIPDGGGCSILGS